MWKYFYKMIIRIYNNYENSKNNGDNNVEY